MAVTQITTLSSLGDIPTVGLKDIISTGNVYFVDSNTGASTYNGLTKDQPLATLLQAHNKCTANKGDVVMLMPGHTESVAAASTLSTAGVTYLGMGVGDNRPIITFTTATSADYILSGGNIRMVNIIFKCGIDSQTDTLDITNKYTIIENCEFHYGSSLECLDTITLTHANADHCKILNCYFDHRAATGAKSAIKIVAALDGLEIAGCRIFGDYSEASIWNPTGNVAINVDIHHNVVQNDNSGDWAIELVSACTGACRYNDLFTDAWATALNPGSLKCSGNRHTAAVDTESRPIPTGYGEQVSAVKATATTPQAGDGTLFTITGGQIEVLALCGEVTTVIESATNISRLKFNPTGTGSDINLCQDLELNGAAAGTLLTITGNPNDVMQSAVWLGYGMAQTLILGPGVIELECDGSTSGSIGWQMVYRRLEAGGTVA